MIKPIYIISSQNQAYLKVQWSIIRLPSGVCCYESFLLWNIIMYSNLERGRRKVFIKTRAARLRYGEMLLTAKRRNWITELSKKKKVTQYKWVFFLKEFHFQVHNIVSSVPNILAGFHQMVEKQTWYLHNSEGPQHTFWGVAHIANLTVIVYKANHCCSRSFYF